MPTLPHRAGPSLPCHGLVPSPAYEMNAPPLTTMSSYLAELPRGLDSHPDCSAHASLIEGFVRDHESIASHPDLPARVRRLMTHPKERDWVPEVVFQALNLAARDVSFKDDQGFLDWSTAWSRELLDKPLLRHLMRLMAPTLVVTGAAKRWRTIHRGSELSAELLEDAGGRGRARARLTFPERLFPGIFLSSLVGAYGAAVSGARGRDTRVELVSSSPTHAEYGVSWVA